MIDVRVVCVPTVGSTSSHCASKRPMPGDDEQRRRAPGLVVDRAQVLRERLRPAAHDAVEEARGDLALAIAAGRGRHELAGRRAQRRLGADGALAVDGAGVVREVDRRDGGAREGDDERDDGDDHGGGWQAKLHDGLLRRGSAGPYFRANPPRAAEVRPPAPSAGTKPDPRTHAARIGARWARWDSAWHADHAHPHRSRPGRHARSPPLSRVALMEGHLERGRAPHVVSRRRRPRRLRPAGACDPLPRRSRRHARLHRADRRPAGGGGARQRPLRPARQRAFGPPARRRFVVLDRRPLRARAHGPGRPPGHRGALPRRRAVVGRHARAAARARAPAGPAEHRRGRLAVVDPRLRGGLQRAARRDGPGRERDDPRRRAQRRDVDAGVPGRGHGVLPAPRLPGRSVARRRGALASTRWRATRRSTGR